MPKSPRMNMYLYYHKTDGGAEYLTDKFIIKPDGSKEGVFQGARIVVRIDGDLRKDAEITLVDSAITEEDNMAQPPAVGLVVAGEGTISLHAPGHVDLRLVYLEDVRAGNTPALPMGVGFEELAEEAGLRGCLNFVLAPGQEHPAYPKATWRFEVQSGKTEFGYELWVKDQIIRQEIGAVDGGE